MKRLSVWLSEQQEADIIELSGGAGTKRAEWVRQAIDAAIDAARHPERITIVPAQGDLCVADVDELHTRITRLQAEIDTLKGENLTLEQDRKEALQRASDAGKEIASLGRLLDERTQRIEDLKTSEDKLVAQAERYQVLLQGAQQAALPGKAGTGQRWWRFWEK